MISMKLFTYLAFWWKSSFLTQQKSSVFLKPKSVIEAVIYFCLERILVWASATFPWKPAGGKLRGKNLEYYLFRPNVKNKACKNSEKWRITINLLNFKLLGLPCPRQCLVACLSWKCFRKSKVFSLSSNM